MDAMKSYPLVIGENRQFQLTVSPNEHFGLVLMGPELMGALNVDGLRQRYDPVPVPCVLTLLTGTPLAVILIPEGGASTMTLGISGDAVRLAPMDGGQTAMRLTSTQTASALVSPIYVGTDIDVPMSRFMDETMADFMFTEVV